MLEHTFGGTQYNELYLAIYVQILRKSLRSKQGYFNQCTNRRYFKLRACLYDPTNPGLGEALSDFEVLK